MSAIFPIPSDDKKKWVTSCPLLLWVQRSGKVWPAITSSRSRGLGLVRCERLLVLLFCRRRYLVLNLNLAIILVYRSKIASGSGGVCVDAFLIHPANRGIFHDSFRLLLIPGEEGRDGATLLYRNIATDQQPCPCDRRNQEPIGGQSSGLPPAPQRGSSAVMYHCSLPVNPVSQLIPLSSFNAQACSASISPGIVVRMA